MSKSQSRNFVAEGVSALIKAATGSSVNSKTSGTSQLIQNDPKQVKKDITEEFIGKYTELSYAIILWVLAPFS